MSGDICPHCNGVIEILGRDPEHGMEVIRCDCCTPLPAVGSSEALNILPGGFFDRLLRGDR